MLSRRMISTSRVAMKSGKSNLDARILQSHANANLTADSPELVLKPELWKGLPRSRVLELYRARVISLGKNYKRSQVELDALLETARNPLEANVLFQVYNSTEADIFAADTDTDYENYVVEGEYMEDKLEGYKFDEYPTSAQDLVRDFRDIMEFNRKAAYELPQLTEFKKQYQPHDAKKQPLTFKYTRYIGETHPAERKVVLTFKVADLGLQDAAAHKLKLLAGSRYDYTNDQVTMSSDKFNEPAQNHAFLSEVVQDLIKEAGVSPEEFADVPLDKRHVDARLNKMKRKNKKFHQFPKEWSQPLSQGDRLVELGDLVAHPEKK